MDQKALVEALGWLARIQSVQHMSSFNSKQQRPSAALLATYCLRTPGTMSNDELVLARLRLARHSLFSAQLLSINWMTFSAPVALVLMKIAQEQRKLQNQQNQHLSAPVPSPVPFSIPGYNVTAVLSQLNQQYHRNQPLTKKETVFEFSARLAESALHLAHHFNLSSSLISVYGFAASLWSLYGNAYLSNCFSHLALQRRGLSIVVNEENRGSGNSSSSSDKFTVLDQKNSLHLQFSRGDSTPASLLDLINTVTRVSLSNVERTGDSTAAKELVLFFEKNLNANALSTPSHARPIKTALLKYTAQEKLGSRQYTQYLETLNSVSAAESTNNIEKYNETDLLRVKFLLNRNHWSTVRYHIACQLCPSPIVIFRQDSAGVIHDPSLRLEHYGK